MFYVYSWNAGADKALWDEDQVKQLWQPYMTLEYSGSLADCRYYLETGKRN